MDVDLDAPSVRKGHFSMWSSSPDSPGEGAGNRISKASVPRLRCIRTVWME